MWIEKNKVIARRFRRELWNSGDLNLADQIIASDCIVHDRVPFATDFTSGPEALKQLVRFYHLIFSDIQTTVENVVAEGDMVSLRWSARGRHTGDLFGISATGREILTSGIDMLRIEEGRIVEGWVSWDTLSLLEQIMMPAEGRKEGGQGTDFLSLIATLQGEGD